MTNDTFNIIFDELNKWLKANHNDIKEKSAAEIGYLLYGLPLRKLLKAIKTHKINGEKFIKYYQKHNKWITNVTGWSEQQVYQIEATLFEHQTFTNKEILKKFKKSLRTNKLTNTDVWQRMTENFDIELEELHYRIKTGQDIHDFSDFVVNMVDDITENNNEISVIQIYKCIAECFCCDYKNWENNVVSSTSLYNLDKQYPWMCNNCGNHNFNNYISRHMNHDLSQCILCGITQIDSVILKLKNHNTFIMVNNVADTKQAHNTNVDDEIDALIKQGINSFESIDLSCPSVNKNDGKICPSILQLAKYLIRYNRWIKTIYSKTDNNNDINTVEVDIQSFINDDLYQQMLKESAKSITKIKEDNIVLLETILKNNIDGIANVETFLKRGRKQFAKCLQKCTGKNINLAIGSKLYKLTMKRLKEKTQQAQFGKFISEIDSKLIDKNYHHILHSHINNGNKLSRENVFRFYEKIVHYEDLDSEKKECSSFKRREQRTNRLNRLDSQNNDDE
eukprot:382247_1